MIRTIRNRMNDETTPVVLHIMQKGTGANSRLPDVFNVVGDHGGRTARNRDLRIV